MSAGTVYHYFGSKEDILYLIIHSATSEQAERIESFARGLDTANATDALTQVVREFYKWHDENQDSTLFAYQETKNLPDRARQMIFDSENRILSVFEELLKRGVELGEFSVSDPKLMAHNIVVMGHSWAFRRWHLRKYWTFETFVRGQVDVILRIIRIDKRG
jgi:AcrR family transcriptional regulator